MYLVYVLIDANGRNGRKIDGEASSLEGVHRDGAYGCDKLNDNDRLLLKIAEINELALSNFLRRG